MALLLSWLGLPPGHPCSALAQERLPRIVIINSYHQGEAWSDAELDGILTTLRGRYPQLTPSIEHLDAKRRPGPENLLRCSQFLAEKYRNHPVDLVMALDNPALAMLTEADHDLFPGVPVVFAGINGLTPDMLASRPAITGVKETEDIAGTLRLALTLQPGTKRVLAVHDQTVSGLALRREMDQALPAFQGRLQVTYSPDVPFAQLREQLQALPSDSVVLILTYVTDQAGHTFSRVESTALISQASSVPVYAMHETRLGHGIVGGMLLEGREHGAQAAGMALQILAGRDPAKLSVVDSHSHPVFDYQQMQRFHLPLDVLPADSRLVNRPVSLWQRHSSVIIPFLVAMAVMFVMVGLLTWSLLRLRRGQAALRQSEARYRQLLDTMFFGVAECDTRGRITYANPALARMQGLEPQALKGAHLSETMAPGQERNDLGFFFEDMSRGQPEPKPYFTTNQRPDGSQYLARVDWSYQRDQQGVVRGFTVIIHDITEPMRAQQALRDSEAKFRQFFEHSNDAIFVHDENGAFLDVNQRACQLLGYSRQELLELIDTRQCHPPEAFPAAQEAFQALLRQGWVRFETVFRRSDGSLINVEVSTSPVGGGKRIYQALARDISERKRAEAERQRLEIQLRQSQKMEAIGTLAGGIAHDFNNILGAILGFAELVREDAQDGNLNPQDVDQIIGAAERARDLIQQILTFSRKVEPQRRPLDLNQEVRRAMELLQHTLPKMIQIELNLAPDLKRVNADPGQISQVLLNLAANAFHAMPEGGRLTITTANLVMHDKSCPTCAQFQTGQWVSLVVSDTGQGIAPQNLPRIFDPFFTTKEVGQGTGLGLSMVHGIIKGHGGHIECTSTPRQGTTFLITLPVLGWAGQPRGEQHASGQVIGGSEIILLVDDEEALRGMGRRHLMAAGYQVRTASNGEEALELYRQSRGNIDLVVMDLGMPGMGGQKALVEILAQDPGAKVVIASGYAAEQQVKSALDAGAAGYVPKPFHRDELLATIRRVLDGGYGPVGSAGSSADA